MRHPIETLWRECGLPEYFLGNDGSNTKLYALYDRIRGVAQIPRTVSDEDWQRAVDCAMSCLKPPFHITRSEFDNAMQHAFGMLSLRAAQAPAEPKDITMQDVRLVCGEGKLEARHVLNAVNIIVKRRAEMASLVSSTDRAAPPSVALEAIDPEKFCIALGWAYGTALERRHFHKEPDDGMTPETLWAASDEDSREFMRGVVRDTFAALTRPQPGGAVPGTDHSPIEETK